MIQAFVNEYMKNKELVREAFSAKHPENYEDIIRIVWQYASELDTSLPYTGKIHTIDDGDYQGTLLFLIPEGEWQPSTYYYVLVNYGSCSGCDTLQGIQSECYSCEVPNEKQIEDYMTLTLHIVQGIKVIGT